jgi:hypothetical protein
MSRSEGRQCRWKKRTVGGRAKKPGERKTGNHASDQQGKASSVDLKRLFETYIALRGRRFEFRKVAGPKYACGLIRKATTDRLSH